eukprot:CAMPEP_0178386126 /NCGR_PEP_ID=MMETSP0689_2-20121128/8391_1 /TAXON_ID=160604 /ORGANISM="Amphidinium massartii, Strain CS-259" /LENGTH=814 /DNA_ID=CAMNT_0020006437 /DNA_START=90 /DNA_END=2534 /DNA_ORIENTATION=-
MVDQGLASSASLDTEQDSFACGQVSKLADGIFTFPSPLRTDVTASLQAELQHFQEECAQSGRSYARPSVLTTSGALLSDMGFQRLAEGLVKEVLSPMVATLFPQTQGLRSDEVLGVMLDYGDDDDPSSASPRRSADETAKESGMGAHFDNSCITLDICLGSEDFEGGDLVFSLPRQSQELAVRQTAGQAVLFSGSLEHWCRPVTRGRRVNLVLWCMSNTRVAAPGVFQRYSEYLALASTSAPALGSHNRECKTHVSFDVPTDYLKRGKHPTRECRPVSHSEGDSASQQEEQWTSSPTFGCNEATAEEVLEDLSDVLDSGSDVAAGHVLALCGVRLLLENFLAGSTKRRGPAARSVIALQRACRSCRDVFQPLAHKVSHHVGNPKLSKEIVTLQLGGCGAALGTAMWSLFSAEHGLNSRGEVACDHAESDELALGVFYGEMWRGRWRPRSVFADLTPGAFAELPNMCIAPFAPSELITPSHGDDDRTSALLDEVSDKVRRHAESCERLQGFNILHGTGGLCGSQFLSDCLDNLSLDFCSKHKLTFSVVPSTGEHPHAFRNCGKALSALNDNADAAVLLEREKLWSICQGIDFPKHFLRGWDLGASEITAQMLSSVMGNVRFEGGGGSALNEDLNSIVRNHVPMPGLHFLTSAVSPLQVKIPTDRQGTVDMTTFAFENLLAGNYLDGKYISCSLAFRGEVVPKDVMAAIVRAKRMHVRFADWSPLGFKCAIEYRMPVVALGSSLFNDNRRVGLLACHTGVCQTFDNILAAMPHKANSRGDDSLEELREGVLSLQKNYEEANGEEEDDVDMDGAESY